ncbi:MAG: Dyp-type peroxidase [Chloroflexota bacterium]
MSVSLNNPISSSSPEFAELSPAIQGNILSSHGRNHAAHLFLRFNDAPGARAVIRNTIAPRITSAAQQKIDSAAAKASSRRRFRHFLGFALSNEGYAFLGIPANETPTDNLFRTGAKAHVPQLQDPDVAAWEGGFQTDWHAVVIAANESESYLSRRVDFLLSQMDSVLESSHVELGMGITNDEGHHIEHFGYVDGISQPLLLTDSVDNDEITTNNWDPRAPLSLALVDDPGGSGDNAFGSYFVFRKLEQNVAGFKAMEADLANRLGVTADQAGAQVVGRFRSGNPLIPVTPPQPQSSGKMNDFDYETDTPRGSKCPFHAHIRKTNPRGSGGAEPLDQEREHLFPRRGITYGGDSTQLEQPPAGGVGLLFMAYNSNIGSQFAFMQSAWANNNNFPFNKPNGPHGIDPVIGQGVNPDDQNYFGAWGDDATEQREPSFDGFVTMKGGEYFFAPSISFLESL